MTCYPFCRSSANAHLTSARRHDSATRASNTSSPAGASTSSFSGPLSTSNSRPNATLSSSNVYAITIPCVIGGMVLVGVVIGLWGKFWRRYKRAGLPPSALYRRSVGAGMQPQSQPQPESRWIGGGGAGREDLASTSLRAAEEAAAVEQDRPGDVGPRELPERTRGEQGHGTWWLAELCAERGETFVSPRLSRGRHLVGLHAARVSRYPYLDRHAAPRDSGGGD